MKLDIQKFAAKTKKTTFSESNFDIEGNDSTLKITIEFSATSSETWFSSKPLSCTCNGKTQTANVSLSKGGTVKKTFTFNNIKHNNDGSKTVSWEWEITTGTSGLGTLTASGTKKLTTISRASTITGITSGYYEEDIANGFDITIEVYLEEDVYHTLNARVIIGENDYIFASKTDEDLNLDSGPNDCTIEFTESELNYLYSLFPSDSSITVYLDLYTFSDSEKTKQVGEKYTEEFTNTALVCEPPTFNYFTYSDVNSNTLALTNDSSKIIKGYSVLQVTIPENKKAIANDSAVMEYYNIAGINYPYADDFVQQISNYTNTIISVFAIDSRGNSTNVIKPIELINYEKIAKISNSAKRANNTGSQVTFNLEGQFWNNNFGSVSNDLTATYRYQKTDTSTPESWIVGSTAIALTKNGNKFSFEGILRGDAEDNGFELEDSYNVVITVSDKLSSVDFTYLVNASSPAATIYKNNISLGGDYDTSRGGRVQILGKFVIDLEYVGEYNDGS